MYSVIKVNKDYSAKILGQFSTINQAIAFMHHFINKEYSADEYFKIYIEDDNTCSVYQSYIFGKILIDKIHVLHFDEKNISNNK